VHDTKEEAFKKMEEMKEQMKKGKAGLNIKKN
jgi:hypothetical protein